VSGSQRPRWVPIAAYVSIFAILGLALVLVLPSGNRIEAAPQMPEVVEVGTDGQSCLGSRLVAVQSGVFLDLHSMGSGGGSEAGPRVAGGEVDRLSGTAVLTGACAEGTSRSDAALTVTGRVTDGEGFEGVLESEGSRLDLTLTSTGLGDTDTDGHEELTGGELIARVLLAVATVIIAARLVGSAFRLIGQPRVIGEITAGILLGPSLLGLIFPNVTGFLFPLEVTDLLEVLAQFGLILFMFLIGLELDHKLIRGSGHTAVLISHYSIVVPLALGMGAALLVYPRVASGDFTGFALFMGAAMAITAFPVLARILTDTGVYRTRLGAMAITCAAVDDVTAWCVLAVVVAIVRAAGPADALTTIILSLLFIVLMVTVVRPLAARLLGDRKERGPLNGTVMSFLIAGLFLSAWATEMIGIHAIFGAFMFGAMLPRDRGIATRIIGRLEDLTVLFLLPVFFAVVGLSTQIGLVTGTELWLLTGLIIAIAVVGKIGGSVVAGLAAGESLRSSTIIGVLMNSRGITEIVILTVGRELGVISPALFTIMVIMALVTTFMTTPLLSWLYPRAQVERDVMVEQHRGEARADYGSRRVMVGVTDPGTARPLVRVAGSLRGSEGEAPTVVLASIIAPPGHEHIRANLNDFADTSAIAAGTLATVADGLDGAGIPTEVVTRIGTNREEELLLLIEQQQIDMIVIGSHQAYLRNRPLGGLVGELLREAPSDVAVTINSDRLLSPGPGPVGVWLAGEPTDFAVLELATSLARGFGRELLVVTLPGADQATGQLDDAVVLKKDAGPDAVVDEIGRAAVIVVAAPTSGSGLHVDVVEILTENEQTPVVVLRTAQARQSRSLDSESLASSPN